MCPEENGVFSANTHHKALMENSFSFFKVPGDHWDTLLSPEPAEGIQGNLAGASQRWEYLRGAKLLQSCPALCSPMDCSPPGSSVYGILQARILEWVAMPCPPGDLSSRIKSQTPVCLLHWQAGFVFFLPLAAWEACKNSYADLKKKAWFENCKLNFIWGRMRTAAQETAPQIALINCSKEVVGGMVSIYMIFGEGGIHAIKHIFFQKVSTSLMKPLLVTGNSDYHEGF